MSGCFFCSCLMIEQLQNERLRIPYSAAVDEGTNLFAAEILFKIFQDINPDGAGKVFVLTGRIDFGYQLINADAFFFGYGGKFGVKFVFQAKCWFGVCRR